MTRPGTLLFPVRHRGTRSCSARAHGGLEIAGRHEVDLGVEDGLATGLGLAGHVRRQVHEQVHVAVGTVLAASNAAEVNAPMQRLNIISVATVAPGSDFERNAVEWLVRKSGSPVSR